MKNLLWIGLLAGAMSLGLTAPAWSHHSHAMFDHTKQITVDGTVTEYVFRNPHVFLYVEVKGENGQPEKYWIEMSNLPNMIRRGIGQNTFKPGDKVKVTLHPLADGRPGGNYISIIAADGKSYE